MNRYIAWLIASAIVLGILKLVPTLGLNTQAFMFTALAVVYIRWLSLNIQKFFNKKED